MDLSGMETIPLSDSDIGTLKKEFDLRRIFFWKFVALILIIAVPFGVFGRFNHPKTTHDYLRGLYIAEALAPLFLGYLYYSINYQIKKDLTYATKLRFRTLIQKTKGDDELKPKDKYCSIIITPLEGTYKEDSQRTLFHYIKKNIMPSSPLKIVVPKDEYSFLKNGEGIIEISRFSKTFLNFKE